MKHLLCTGPGLLETAARAASLMQRKELQHAQMEVVDGGYATHRSGNFLSKASAAGRSARLLPRERSACAVLQGVAQKARRAIP